MTKQKLGIGGYLAESTMSQRLMHMIIQWIRLQIT
jgi:hypothetical protein